MAIIYTRTRMLRKDWKGWAAAVISAALLELPFPLAGPMPPWRAIFAWFGLVPVLWAVLRAAGASERPLRHAFLVAYLCGVLWFAGNCYWIYDTMLIHGGIPPVGSALMLLAFSLVLGAYFGLFGLGVAVVARRFGRARALAAAPFLWAAQELLASRITSVPWDQLGYSQVDNLFVCTLAPSTGVYGISFLLVLANALLAGSILLTGRCRVACAVAGPAIVLCGVAGLAMKVSPAPIGATAVLVQPNLDVTNDDPWGPQVWNQHIAVFESLADEQCKKYVAGIPQTGAPQGEVVCPAYPTHPDLVAWPEAPAPFYQMEPRFKDAVKEIARSAGSPVVVGGIGMEYAENDRRWREYNSAMLFDQTGKELGRYDKIHLVPFGEFVPYQDLFFFAKKLTGRVSQFDRGRERSVYRIVDQHGQMRRYSFLICYEAVFADEVRQFARNGAEVLVNISDDGWYGDTSAPWQHLNMARMRAIENRRWLLRDTNNGVTAAIDPYGQVRQSIPRHAADALPAQYGFRDDVTFYTAHGDVFGWLCAILSLGIVVWAFRAPVRS
jgi:apolipoprotein N-acyltransferase